ncbi:MAG: FHA domain-containing protein [Lachnospiraceae bacterium]|nr:FHA domain-containing protein [Lachnospiraceae bacterium]
MIKEQDGKYYISDLNSLNGTGVNGRMLDANETAQIADGDRVSLAGSSFTFRCA